MTTAITRAVVALAAFALNDALPVRPVAAQDRELTVIYRDGDQYSADDFVITQFGADHRFGRFYNGKTKTWDYGWHSTRDFFDDSQRGSPYHSFYWKRDFGWYFDPTMQEWRYGFHYDDDFGLNRGSKGQLTAGAALQIEGVVRHMMPVPSGDRLHMLAVIDTVDRGLVRVDLGDSRESARQTLTVGDTVTVVGRTAGPRGDVLVAERVTAPSGSIRLNIDPAQRRLVADRPQQPLRRTADTAVFQRYAGDILDTQTRYVHDREHVFVRMVLPDGQEFEADLGPAELFDPADMKPGSAITILGQPLHRGQDGEIIRADHVRVGHLSLTIPRADRTRDEQTDGLTRGLIRHTYRQEIHGEEHLIAQIDTDDGRLLATDLGPTWKLGDRPKEGDRVAVTGSLTQEAGNLMLVADEVRLDNHAARTAGHRLTHASTAMTFEPRRLDFKGPSPAADDLPAENNQMAEAQDDGAAHQSESANAASTEVAPQSQWVGRIESLEQINILGRRHTRARMRLQDGRFIDIDLGPAAGLNSLPVNRGDQIAVSIARQPRDGGVLVADSFTTLQEPALPRRAGVGSLRLLEGRVLAVRHDRLPGYEGTQLIATIQLTDGTTCRVLVGAGHRLDEAGINPGAEIHVRANPDAADPTLFIAQELRVNEKLILGVP